MASIIVDSTNNIVGTYSTSNKSLALIKVTLDMAQFHNAIFRFSIIFLYRVSDMQGVYIQ